MCNWERGREREGERERSPLLEDEEEEEMSLHADKKDGISVWGKAFVCDSGTFDFKEMGESKNKDGWQSARKAKKMGGKVQVMKSKAFSHTSHKEIGVKC